MLGATCCNGRSSIGDRLRFVDALYQTGLRRRQLRSRHRPLADCRYRQCLGSWQDLFSACSGTIRDGTVGTVNRFNVTSAMSAQIVVCVRRHMRLEQIPRDVGQRL